MFSWAKDLDFSQVDYWFIPVHIEEHFVLFVIDNVRCKFDYLHSTIKEGWKKQHVAAAEKVIGYIEHYVRSRFNVAPRKKYTWKEFTKVQQQIEFSSGMYVLNWCTSWEGRYEGKMSSLWKTADYTASRRIEFVKNLVLFRENEVMPRLVERSSDYLVI
ncbi:hypothetical protein LINGRAHAP2_LOCUS23206 [Linum grandiflorum]